MPIGLNFVGSHSILLCGSTAQFLATYGTFAMSKIVH